MKSVYLLIFICLSGFGKTVAQAGDQHQELTRKLQLLTNALIHKDSSTLGDLLAEDVSYGHSNGLVQTKKQIIGDVMQGVQQYITIENMDVKTRMYGNSGIINLHCKVNMSFKGKALELDMMILMLWIKTDGNWKLAGRQSASIAK